MKKLHSTCACTRRDWGRSAPVRDPVHLYVIGRGVHQPADGKITFVAGRRELQRVVQHFAVAHANDKAIKVASHCFPGQSEVTLRDF